MNEQTKEDLKDELLDMEHTLSVIKEYTKYLEESIGRIRKEI